MGKVLGKRDRVMAVLRNEPADRPVYAFWRHFYEAEFSLDTHVASVLWWQDQVQNDLLKVQPRAQFFGEDWGLVHRYPSSGVVLGAGHMGPRIGTSRFAPADPPHERPVRLDYPVKLATDWGKIRPLPADGGARGERLEALRLLRASLPEDVPLLETVFTPLAIAARLTESDDAMADFLEREPTAVHEALQAITETYAAFAKACIEAGAAGIFLATTQWGTRQRLSEAQHLEFGRRYDLPVLEAVRAAPLNVLHVCENDSLLFELADYPAPILSWAAGAPANPTLSEAQQRLPGKVMLGGVRQASLAEPTPARAVAEVANAWRETGARRWIAGPDCSVPVYAPIANVRSVASALRGQDEPSLVG